MHVFAAETVAVSTALVTAVAMGVVLGLFKAIPWLIEKMKPTTAPSQAAHWTDVTGEVRPITANECRAQHDKLAADLSKGSDRFSILAESTNNIEKAVLRMEGDVKLGFSEVKAEVRETIDAAIERHERSPLHRTSSYPRSVSGNLPKPKK